MAIGINLTDELIKSMTEEDILIFTLIFHLKQFSIKNDSWVLDTIAYMHTKEIIKIQKEKEVIDQNYFFIIYEELIDQLMKEIDEKGII